MRWVQDVTTITASFYVMAVYNNMLHVCVAVLSNSVLDVQLQSCAMLCHRSQNQHRQEDTCFSKLSMAVIPVAAAAWLRWCDSFYVCVPYACDNCLSSPPPCLQLQQRDHDIILLKEAHAEEMSKQEAALNLVTDEIKDLRAKVSACQEALSAAAVRHKLMIKDWEEKTQTTQQETARLRWVCVCCWVLFQLGHTRCSFASCHLHSKAEA